LAFFHLADGSTDQIASLLCCTRRTEATWIQVKWPTVARIHRSAAPDGLRAGASTLVEDPDSQVFVAVYDVTPGDESTLDEWESADTGLYRKVRIRVATLDGEVAAWVYVLNDFEGGIPSARTIGILADAAEAAGAPTDYVAELRSRPCVSGW
jgi:hypothetical protein